jgi:DUF438 domain-containing protein
MNDSMDRAKRQEILKNLIQELHAGKSVDDVKGAFARLIQDVDPSEIAEMEQSLIAEGLPEADVKRLCDVHVAVFRESLDAQAQARPETIPGHPVHTFLAENAAAEKVLAALQEAIDALQATPGTAQLAKTRQELARLREYETHTVLDGQYRAMCAKRTFCFPTWNGTISLDRLR